MQNVKIVSDSETLSTKVYVNGKQIERVKSIAFNQSVDTVPEFWFEVYGCPDIMSEGTINLDISPNNIQSAVFIFRNELAKQGDLYEAFVGSVAAAIRDEGLILPFVYESEKEIAQKIVDFIIG